MTDPIVAARYVLDGVVTTVDAVNGAGSLDRQPEAVKQRLNVLLSEIGVDGQVFHRAQELRLERAAQRTCLGERGYLSCRELEIVVFGD
jgi:hypothetical protein